MNENPFLKFIKLIEFDQFLNSKEKEIEKIELEVQALKKDIIDLNERLGEKEKRMRNIRKEVDEKELMMAELDELERSKKKVLSEVADEKEYRAAKKEISRLRLEQNRYESVLMDTWNRLNLYSKDYETQKKEYDEKMKELELALKKKTDYMEDLKEKLKEEYKKRPDLEKGIDAEWLEKYAVMRSSVLDPVVPVVNGSCGACFYNISNQDLLDLKRNKLLQCKCCYRFLYMPNDSSD